MKPRVNYLFHMSQSLLIIGLFQESESYFLPTQLSIYSFNEYLVSAYYVPGNVAVKTQFVLSGSLLHSSGRQWQAIQQVNM